jgi:uncharacterized FlaG/YvyC family protein
MSIEKSKFYSSLPPERVTLNRSAAKADNHPKAPGQPSGDDVAPTLRTIERVAQDLESYMKSVGRSIEFKVDQESGRTVISVRDSHTGELIRQIPGEEVLRLARRMDASSMLHAPAHHGMNAAAVTVTLVF